MGFWSRKRKQKRAVNPSPRPGPRKKLARAPLELKLAAMDGLARGLSAKEIADLLEVSDASVYKWRQVFEKEGIAGLQKKSASPSLKRRCKALEERILARRKENPDAGVRRIRDQLRREEGLTVSAETVRQVVNEAGLQRAPQKSKRRRPQVRRFERSVPNALWQIDIFTFELKRMYRVYLVAIIDDHSRYIVSHGLFRQQTADAVLEVVKGAIGEFGAPREILSDNGRQFVAWRGKSRFQKVLRRQGIGHVRSAPHHPMTLGKIERYWKTIWVEFLEEAVFASFADARQRLEHWVNYYNFQRPHQGIKGACPADRFFGVANPVEEAVQQGCRENSLRLALGQEPKPPLFLLGQLGETDVRVQRKGEDIEIRVGDSVHETIRMGAPFQLEGKEGERLEESNGEVEGDGTGGAVPGSADGDDWQAALEGVMREFRDEPDDAEQGHRQSQRGRDSCTGTETAGAPEQTHRAAGPGDPGSQECIAGEGGHPVEDKMGGDPHGPGPGAEDCPGGTSDRRGEKKEATQGAQTPSQTDVTPNSENNWYEWDESEDGV